MTEHDDTRTDRELLFPYMAWAKASSELSSVSLSQSGMPRAAPGVFEGLALDPRVKAEAASRALREHLAARYGVDPARILITIGASAAMMACALRWFRAPARVLSELPCYEPVRRLPTLFGAEAVRLGRRLEEGWRVRPAAVRDALEGARGPGHLFLTNPHNPSGTLLGEEDLRALASEAGRAGGILFANEIYMDFVPEAGRVHACRLAPNAISLGGLTKAYGLGELRLGWMVFGEGLAREVEALRDVTHLDWVDPPTICMQAALRALEHADELLAPLREVERTSRPLWKRWLQECPLVECVVPPFGIVAFPRVVGIRDTRGLCEHLQREHDVDVTPGEFFGAPGHLRVACGVPEAELREGLLRLERGIASWKARG